MLHIILITLFFIGYGVIGVRVAGIYIGRKRVAAKTCQSCKWGACADHTPSSWGNVFLFWPIVVVELLVNRYIEIETARRLEALEQEADIKRALLNLDSKEKG